MEFCSKDKLKKKKTTGSCVDEHKGSIKKTNVSFIGFFYDTQEEDICNFSLTCWKREKKNWRLRLKT